MGLRRFFRDLQRDARLRGPRIDYEGMAVPTQRSGMNWDILVHLHDSLTPAQIQSIHDAMAAQGLRLQEPSPGGTVVIYARSGGT